MTIEERALRKYPIFISEYSDSCEEYDSNESDRLTYIEGATDQDPISRTEQKKRDIKKACKVYADLLSAQGYDIGSINTELSRLKKAMEE